MLISVVREKRGHNALPSAIGYKNQVNTLRLARGIFVTISLRHSRCIEEITVLLHPLQNSFVPLVSPLCAHEVGLSVTLRITN